jgi:DNA polymerase III subunit delta
MIVFLYGKDSYRLKQNLEKIVAEYKKKHENGMAFHVFELAENANDGLEKFENSLKTIGFFDERQLIVVKNSFVIADKIVELIKKWDLSADKEKIVVFVENGTEAEVSKRSKKLFTLLNQEGNMVKYFEPLSGRQLENWLVKEAEANEVKIDSMAMRKLIENVGQDSWALKQEIDKLANYCLAVGKKTITANEVNLLVFGKVDLNIFEAIEAIAGNNRGRAVTLLNKHLSGGEDPYYLFSMVVYQFRNLLKVKSLAGTDGTSVLSSDAIAKKAGLHPFVVKKALEHSRKLSLEDLKRQFTRLADYDVAIKNSEIDIIDCLYQIALS